MPDKEPTISDIINDQKQKEKELEALFEKGEVHFAVLASLMADTVLKEDKGELTLVDYASLFLPKLKEFLASLSREQLEEMATSHALGALENGVTQLMLFRSMGLAGMKPPESTDHQ